MHYVWMSGWVDRWTGGWVERRMGRWVDRLVDEWMGGGCMSGWVGG